MQNSIDFEPGDFHNNYEPSDSPEDSSDSLARFIKLFVSRFNIAKAALPFIVEGLKAAYRAGQSNENIKFPSVNSLMPRHQSFLKNSYELCTNCDSILRQKFCEKCDKECPNPSFLSVGNLQAQFETLFNALNLSIQSG